MKITKHRKDGNLEIRITTFVAHRQYSTSYIIAKEMFKTSKQKRKMVQEIENRLSQELSAFVRSSLKSSSSLM